MRRGHGRRRERGRLARFVRARLHRRIFVWFGASILASVAVAATVATVLVGHGDSFWHRQMSGVRVVLSQRFAAAWDDPHDRASFGEAISREMGFFVELLDEAGRPVAEFGVRGDHCRGCGEMLWIEREGRVLGAVRIHAHHPRHSPLPLLLVLAAAGFTLWAASGVIARRLARPLDELARVVREIGAGNLASRVDLGRHQGGEVGEVAAAVNDMAARIEKQLADQRELLAAVSHEMRTPLGHLRVLVELARDGGADPATADDMERELVEADALIDELLASSRLEFQALTRTTLVADDVARRAAQRAELPDATLDLAGHGAAVRGDATLLGRALANLVDNARGHGGGVTALRVREGDATVRFEVEDAGPGFSAQALEHAFDTFFRAAPESSTTGRAGSLGLGLALVDRIARAHGGRAGAENRDERGARVWIELPREGAAA
jgi:signal transduction histidine kinase